MNITPLRSGSSGNCTLITSGNTRILIDAGIASRKGLLALLDEAGLEPFLLSAIVATHLHRDHINQSTLRICSNYAVPLYLHEKNAAVIGSLHAAGYLEGVVIKSFGTRGFTIGDMQLEAFGVSHDAPGTTCGYRISTNNATLTYAADLGHFPQELVSFFAGSDIVFLEANHDTDLLWDNPARPYHHKKRVAGKRGHLSNEQAGKALVQIFANSPTPPHTVILGHLSADHNSPRLAVDTVGTILKQEGIHTQLHTAYRDRKLELSTRPAVGLATSEEIQTELFMRGHEM